MGQAVIERRNPLMHSTVWCTAEWKHDIWINKSLINRFYVRLKFCQLWKKLCIEELVTKLCLNMRAHIWFGIFNLSDFSWNYTCLMLFHAAEQWQNMNQVLNWCMISICYPIHFCASLVSYGMYTVSILEKIDSAAIISDSTKEIILGTNISLTLTKSNVPYMNISTFTEDSTDQRPTVAWPYNVCCQ